MPVILLVLKEGSDLNDWVIRGTSYLVAGTGNIVHLIAGSAGFLLAFSFVVIVLKRTAYTVEVTARFSLDKMAKNSILINSELASCIITEYEAMENRKRLQKEVNLYSAIDRGFNYVSGYYKIIILSIFIIILGGILIEILHHGGEIFSAIKIYIPLAIGSGVIFLLPVLLLSMTVSFYLRKSVNEEKKILYQDLKPVNEEIIKKIKSINQNLNEMKIIQDDIIRLEIGLGLIHLVDEYFENNLLKRISLIHKEIERETGICIPRIRIRDNINLKEFEYSFYICGKEMIKYEIEYNKYLCIENGRVKNKIDGKCIKDPTFGLPAILINKEQIEDAVDAGYIVADAQDIISVSLRHFMKEKLFEIFTYDNSKNLLEKVSESNPLLIYDCYSKYRHIEIKRILSKILEKKKNLLDIVKIIELLIFYADEKDDIDKITELIIKELPQPFTPTAFEVIEGIFAKDIKEYGSFGTISPAVVKYLEAKKSNAKTSKEK